MKCVVCIFKALYITNVIPLCVNKEHYLYNEGLSTEYVLVTMYFHNEELNLVFVPPPLPCAMRTLPKRVTVYLCNEELSTLPIHVTMYLCNEELGTLPVRVALYLCNEELSTLPLLVYCTFVMRS